MKKSLGIRTAMALAAAFTIINCNLTAHAGDINGNEQSVIAVAGGQFEYNGEQYRAKSEYMGALRQYLARDDVDLTADQAQAAIAQIYANVKTGVDGGYLEKIGGDTPPETEKPSGSSSSDTSSGSPPSGTHSANEANGALTEDGVSQNASEAAQSGGQTENTTSESINGNVPEGTEAHQEEGKAETDQPVDESTNSFVGEAEREAPEAAAIPPSKELIYLEEVAAGMELASGAQTAASVTQNLTDLETTEFYKSTLFPDILLKLLPGLSSACGIVIIVLTVVTLAKKLYAKNHHGRYRSVMKKIRAALKALLLVLMLSTLMTTALALGEYQNATVTKSLDKTQYYEAIYGSTVEAVSDIYSGLQMPKEDITACVSPDKVTIAGKKQLEKDLHGGSYSTNAELMVKGIENGIRSYLKKDRDIILTMEADRGLGILTGQLDNRFTDILRWDFASFWHQRQVTFQSMAKWLLPLNIILIITCHILLIALHHFKYRGVRECGMMISAASLVTLISGLSLRIWRDAFVLKAAANLPVYEQEFYHLFVKENSHVILMIGTTGILIGVGYVCLAKVIKEGVK